MAHVPRQLTLSSGRKPADGIRTSVWPSSGLRSGICSSEIFFESVPDGFLDVTLEQWKWSEGDTTVPIVLPRSYINMYNFTFAEVDGKIYFRENNIMTEVTETGKRLDRIKALNELRKTFREILTEQENNCSDERLAELQSILNRRYDSFVKQFGYVNDSANEQE